ncbi:3-deoxy-D-manno-octulosonic acid transferase [Marinagarivorans algicola]|uniref:3-deoxy-D-manno-octulosonic acid transferase n=1 Tax=Marinagarivorans algicola TaxID=1513270 RepID=UPI0006B94E97|nr:3-deoxy-D-manno-octulosonic acid transferase [Marinagarivorans algicola]
MTRAILAVYQLLSILLLPFIVIGLLVRARTQAAYGKRLGERLGFCPKPRNKDKSGNLVIHGASLGEIAALKPFIEQVMQQYTHYTVTVTSFTPAGSSQIKKLFGQHVHHTYLPIDNPLCNGFFLNRLKPDAIIFMETELWPSLIQQARKRDIQLLLINARLSKKSVPNYQKIHLLITPVLQCFNAILAQSDENKTHFLQLGANPNTTYTAGNLKYDLQLNDTTKTLITTLTKTLDNRPVWVVGSSHQDEETLIFTAFKKILIEHPNTLLVLAPRHAERYSPIIEQLQEHAFKFVQRSRAQAPSHDTQVWLVDTIGELLAFYGIASVCTVAGSFGATGGHNPLEPALFHKATTLGPNMQNAAELTQQLLAAHAIIQQPNNNAQTLADNITQLLSSHEKREQLGANAYALLQQNQGATKKALEALNKVVPLRP